MANSYQERVNSARVTRTIARMSGMRAQHVRARMFSMHTDVQNYSIETCRGKLTFVQIQVQNYETHKEDVQTYRTTKYKN
jgi:hypothetical protein